MSDTAELTIATSTVWVLVAAVLVMFMQAGFAFLEAGLTRMKNVGHIAAKNVLVLALASIVYYLVGFGIAFGDGGNGLRRRLRLLSLRSTSCWRSAPRPSPGSRSIPGAAGYLFEVVFCAVSLAIVWGAMAERTRLWVYFAFGVAFTLVYSLVSHWIWSPDGWLFAQRDAGLRRLDRRALPGRARRRSPGRSCSGRASGSSAPTASRTRSRATTWPYTTLGVLILWFGWFGFNPGSTLERRLRRRRLLRVRRAEHEPRGGRRRDRRRR